MQSGSIWSFNTEIYQSIPCCCSLFSLEPTGAFSLPGQYVNGTIRVVHDMHTLCIHHVRNIGSISGAVVAASNQTPTSWVNLQHSTCNVSTNTYAYVCRDMTVLSKHWWSDSGTIRNRSVVDANSARSFFGPPSPLLWKRQYPVRQFCVLRLQSVAAVGKKGRGSAFDLLF